MERLKKSFPPGVDYRIVYDPTIFVRESIDAVVHTLLRGHPAGRHRRDRVPADVAGVDHSAGRGAGLARRHVRDDARPRLLAQHALALRPGPGHRHRGRRRDRGGGERRAAHRAGPAADRGDAAGDGRSVRTDHRHRAGAGRRVRADGVRQRPHRPVLPAVRADHRDLDGHLGVQLADPESRRWRRGCLRAHGAPRDGVQRAIDRLFGWFFRRFNRGVLARLGAVRRRRRRACCASPRWRSSSMAA